MFVSMSLTVAAARNMTSASAGNIGFAASVISGLAQGSSDYFDSVGVSKLTSMPSVLCTVRTSVHLAGSLWRSPAAAP